MILHLSLLRISPQHRYIMQTSIPLFSSFFSLLLSIIQIKHFFILVFSDPILFSLYFFQCSTFPVLLSIFLLCLSLHILYFLFLLLSFLSVFYFLSCCLLSFSSDFLYHLIFLSASIYFFVFCSPSWISSPFILCLSSIIIPYSSLYLFVHLCYYF